MRNSRSVLRLLILAPLVVMLASCTAPPEPPLSGTAPKLIPDSIAYDNISLQTSRKQLFDNTCKTIKAEFPKKAGLVGRSGEAFFGGCQWNESFGAVILRQQVFKDQDKTPPFEIYWHGEKLSLAGYHRVILLERYYAIRTIGENDCSLIIDVGSATPLQVTVGDLDPDAPPSPPETVIAQRCPKAKQIAEQFLVVTDPNGGSRKQG